MQPLPYNSREKNIIQTILEENYTEFENIKNQNNEAALPDNEDHNESSDKSSVTGMG
jgi:hypothetical protein